MDLCWLCCGLGRRQSTASSESLLLGQDVHHIVEADSQSGSPSGRLEAASRGGEGRGFSQQPTPSPRTDEVALLRKVLHNEQGTSSRRSPSPSLARPTPQPAGRKSPPPAAPKPPKGSAKADEAPGAKGEPAGGEGRGKRAKGQKPGKYVNGTDECAICLELFTEESPAVYLECGHAFHLHCTYEWLERSTALGLDKTCALCLTAIQGYKDV